MRSQVPIPRAQTGHRHLGVTGYANAPPPRRPPADADDDDEPPPLESDTESDDEGDEPERVPFGSNREFVVLFAGIPGWDALPEQAASRHNITAYPYDTEREGRSHDLACDVVCATAF